MDVSQLQRENAALRAEIAQLQRRLAAPQQPCVPAAAEAGARVDWQAATLESLFAALPDYIFVVERGTMAMPFCNDVFARGIGYPGRAAVEGRTIYECFPPAEASHFARQNEQVFTTGLTLHEVEQVNLPDGTHHFDTYKIPIRDADGQIIGLLGTSRDITELVEARQALAALNAELEQRVAARTEERARAEAALRASEQRFRAVLDGSPITVFTQDRELRYTWLHNPAVGATDDQRASLGKTDEELFGAAEGARLTALKSQVLATGVGRRAEVPLILSGQTRTYDLRVEPLVEEAGEIAGVMCVAIDITERVAAERALRASEARYRLITEHSGDLILLLDREAGGSVLYASPSHLRVLGYIPETGSMMGLAVHPDDRAEAERVNRESIERGVAEGTLRLRAADGSYRWLEGRISTFVQDGRQLSVSVAHDITGRRQLEAQLFQAQKLEGIGRLAGGVAHDFNNLLVVISGAADLARASMPPDHPAQADLHEIQLAASRAASLTRQLLAFARRQLTDPRPLDLATLITNLSPMLRRLLREDIQLVTALAPGLWTVRGDAGQLEQMILNLAVNAQDAMPEGGRLTIEAANMDLDGAYVVTHPQLQPGRYVLLALSDTGVGMSEAVLRQAFDPFFTTKPIGQGTGLGLSICYGIVAQHGGSIYLYSEPGHGTVVKIYLPQAAEQAAEQPAELGPELTRGHETLLLVEDEPAVRALAARVLRSQGYTVLEAASGAEALQVAAGLGDAPIHLLITDTVMPGMSGPALAEQLMLLRPGIKVLVMSGYIADTAAHPLPPEVTQRLQKPFTPAALARAARAALGDAGKGAAPPGDAPAGERRGAGR